MLVASAPMSLFHSVNSVSKPSSVLNVPASRIVEIESHSAVTAPTAPVGNGASTTPVPVTTSCVCRSWNSSGRLRTRQQRFRHTRRGSERTSSTYSRLLEDEQLTNPDAGEVWHD